jgi:uracil-DNA glycosylase
MPHMNVSIEASWKRALAEEFTKPYFKELSTFVRNEYLSANVYPLPKFVFRAFALTPFDAVKVVILGQDPYHGAGASAWIVLLGSRGCSAPAIAAKHLQRDAE